MKKNTKPTDRKRTFAIFGLSALCVAILAGVYFLTREPEREFIPASMEASGKTDTWKENPAVDAGIPSAAPEESTQLQGTVSDNTQTVVSEDKTGSTTSLSDSSAKNEILREKPSAPPMAKDDATDSNKPPEYNPSQQGSSPDNPTGDSGTEKLSGGTGSGGGQSNQVYDPVFGWVTPSGVQQDNIDSGGDINKQIGTMGGN